MVLCVALRNASAGGTCVHENYGILNGEMVLGYTSLVIDFLHLNRFDMNSYFYVVSNETEVIDRYIHLN